MRFWNVVAAALLASAASSGVAQTSLQAAFDEASGAFEAKEWQRAAELYSAVRSRIPETSKRSRAVASLREGYARSQLNQGASAKLLLEHGVSYLPSDPALDSDRLLALQELARIYEGDNELGIAAQTYRKQLSLNLDKDARRGAITGYLRTAMFEEPEAAAVAASELIKLSDGSSHVNAVALNLMGRAQLIAGQHQKAIKTLEAALSAAGGLTSKTDSLDASIRADLALAGLLAGDEAMAHRFLAATGAARDKGGYLPSPSQLASVICPSNATQDDFAIVEFQLGADGRPTSVRPVYATRRRGLAEAMAKYVSSLAWNPEVVRHLRPLQASMARLEVHCTAEDPASARVRRTALPVVYWLAAQGIPPLELEAPSERERLSLARAELAAREAKFGADSIQLLPVLQLFESSHLLSYSDSIEAIDRQLAIARAAKAPPSVIANLLASRAVMGVTDSGEGVRKLGELRQTWPFVTDPESRLLLAYYIADWTPMSEGVSPELLSIAATSELPENHPLRRGANLRASELERRDKARIHAYQREAGVARNECRLATVSYDRRAAGRLFPNDALRWGFEGWGLVKLDLTQEGQVSAAKPLINYPPLVFTRASLDAARSLNYRVSDTVQPGLGCTGQTITVQFKMP